MEKTLLTDFTEQSIKKAWTLIKVGSVRRIKKLINMQIIFKWWRPLSTNSIRISPRKKKSCSTFFLKLKDTHPNLQSIRVNVCLPTWGPLYLPIQVDRGTFCSKVPKKLLKKRWLVPFFEKDLSWFLIKISWI